MRLIFILILSAISITQVFSQKKVEKKYTIIQKGNNNKQYNTIINKENVYKPTDTLIKRILDSTITSKDEIIIKYENSQALKNRKFAIDLGNALIKLGNYSVMLRDDLIMWNIPQSGVEVYKSGKTIMVFVHVY